MSATTDDIHTSKMMSALSAISSLASSLLPNAIDLQQINQLISCLIQMPSTVSTSDVVNDTNGEDLKLQKRKEKHRQTERNRHNTIIELIRQLSQLIGLQDRHESQANTLNRSARYVIFLTHVIRKLEIDSNDDTIDLLSEEWLQSLYPLYERAFEEATNLINNCCEGDNNRCLLKSSQESGDPLNHSRDHCLTLVSMAFRK